MGNLGPIPEIPYAEWGAIKSDGTLLGNLAEAADVALADTIIADTALVVGAGLTGYWLGQKIMEGMNVPDKTIPPLQYVKPGATEAFNYRVFFTYKIAGQAPVSTSVDIQGPAQGLASEGFGAEQTRWFLVSATGSFVYLLQAASSVVEVEPTITDIQRVDGQPNTSPAFPPDFRRTPIPTTPLTHPTTIPVPGIPDPQPITPTVIPVSPEEKPAPYDPTLKGPLVLIPETGTAIQYSPTGVTVGRYNPPEDDKKAPPVLTPTRIGTKTPSEECPCPPVDLTKVYCKLDYLERYATDQGNLYATITGPSGDSGRITSVPNEIDSVLMVLDPLPSNAKVQYGNANGPNIVFAGWLSFTVSGSETERIPIQYRIQRFIAPPRADGYSFTCTNGITCTTEYTTVLRQSPDDHC